MKNILIVLIFLVSFSSCATKSSEVIFKNNVNDTWKHLVAIDSIAKISDNQRSTGTKGAEATKNYLVNYFTNNKINVDSQTFVTTEGKKAVNVIAEIPGKSSDIILIGAHYDSVEFGPGINDNATGVAILLALAKQINESNIKPNYTIQFAFWDAEEIGLQGSKYFVDNISEDKLSQIKYYVNLDMIGTTNPNILLLDSDNSSFENFAAKLAGSGLSKEEIKEFVDGMISSSPQQVQGSKELEDIFSEFFTKNNINFTDDYTASLSTDVLPFIGKVPTTGIAFTNEIEQVDDEGNTIVLFAPCYHQSCDDIKNVDKKSLQTASNAIAYLVTKLAYQ